MLRLLYVEERNSSDSNVESWIILQENENRVETTTETNMAVVIATSVEVG